VDGWVGSLRNEATGYESHSSVGDMRSDTCVIEGGLVVDYLVSAGSVSAQRA